MQTKYYLLTRTIPEWNSKHKNLYTCSIGFSPHLGLIRVYPIPIKSDFHSGYVYDIEIEKRKTDTRFRSYELVNGYGLDAKYKLIGNFNYKKLTDYFKPFITNSINELNRKKDSIGIIPINGYKVEWQYCNRFINTSQIGMFEDVELANFVKYTKESRDKEARVIFNDADGLHNLQYNEWGVYEFGRKYGSSEQAFTTIKDATHILVGNMLQFQSNWMVLKFLRLENKQINIFDSVEYV